MPVHHPTVFVVDDDASIRHSLAWMLASAGLGTEAFATAEDFLAAIEPQRSGCLLVDLHLPSLACAALLDALARRGVTLPVIVISGDVAAAAVVRALPHAVFALLHKPCSAQSLLTQIRAALAADQAARAAR